MRIAKKSLTCIVRNILSEGKAEDLVSQHPQLQVAYDNGIRKEAHLRWLLKMERFEPIADTMGLIWAFERNKQRLAIKDLSEYANPSDLRSSLEELGDSEGNKRRQLKESETDVVYNSGKWLVVMPHTMESSAKWGAGTTWCTAATKTANLFYSYVANKEEDIVLYYILKKGGDSRADPNAKMSIGFRDGEIDIEETMGGITVNANNEGLTLSAIKSALGEKFKKIFLALRDHSKKIGGKHPAKKVLQDMAKHDDVSFLIKHMKKMNSDQRYGFIETLVEFELGENIKYFIAKDEDERVRLKLCKQQEQMTPELLSLFARDTNEEIRETVAWNKMTPKESVFLLAKDEDHRVRSYLTRRIPEFPELISTLSTDLDARVRASISRSDFIPRSVLIKLLHDPDENVRADASYNAKATKDDLLELASDESDVVRENLAFNKSLDRDIIAIVIENSKNGMSDKMKANLASNLHTPHEYLEKFSFDENRLVRIEVAKNIITPGHILDRLARDSGASVAWFVAGNTSTLPETLSFIANNSDQHDVSNIASNPEAPPEILRQIANNDRGFDNYVINYVARNPNTPADVVARLAKSSDAGTRCFVAENEKVSEEILASLADDSSASLRACVARHKKTPIAVLQKLSNDKNSHVKKAAIDNIASRSSSNRISERWMRIIHA